MVLAVSRRPRRRQVALDVGGGAYRGAQVAFTSYLSALNSFKRERATFFTDSTANGRILCCTILPMTSAALTDAFLSFSGTPLFVLVNMSTSCFRRDEGAMRESGRVFDAAPTLP